MEQQDIQTKIDLYTQVFNDAKERVGDEAALAIVDQIGKHLRVAEIRSGKGFAAMAAFQNGDDQPATQKQIVFMEQLGLEIPEGISKREASVKLDEALSK